MLKIMVFYKLYLRQYSIRWRNIENVKLERNIWKVVLWFSLYMMLVQHNKNSFKYITKPLIQNLIEDQAETTFYYIIYIHSKGYHSILDGYFHLIEIYHMQIEFNLKPFFKGKKLYMSTDYKTEHSTYAYNVISNVPMTALYINRIMIKNNLPRILLVIIVGSFSLYYAESKIQLKWSLFSAGTYSCYVANLFRKFDLKKQIYETWIKLVGREKHFNFQFHIIWQ